MISNTRALIFVVVFLLSSCASKPPQIPYPAFIHLEDIPESFLATLPGTRSKIFNADVHSRRSSMVLQLPPNFNFGTGGEPDKSLEIYVLEGEITLGEFTLEPGGYAYLPSGSMGVSMTSEEGAVVLYFIDQARPGAAIQTPLISNSNLLAWRSDSDGIDDFGLSYKEMRHDPGSGARTWLLRVEPGATLPWQSSSAIEEGYLVSGQYQHSECVGGIPSPGEYASGGYYLRAANAVNGGPSAAALETSIWYVRILEEATITKNHLCGIE